MVIGRSSKHGKIMLPAPVFSRRARSSISRRFDALRQRSRITNLAVLILLALAFMSLLLNLSLWLRPLPSVHVPLLEPNRYRQHPASILSTISSRITATNLVVVAGHAIWKGCLPERRLYDTDWVLEEYQKGTRSITAFFSHIVRG